MTTTAVTHKRGDTFSYAGTVTLPAGTWSATAQLRKKGKADTEDPDVEVTVTLTPPVAPITTTGVVMYAKAADVDELLGHYYFDVEFTDTSTPPVVLSTTTILFDFIRDITHV